jgi:CRP-like cAMP-binding protein|mmetsp:Transcript_107211/g.167464  ORF Transcript_107211/g.167464 Transcript_107211/m.167464 type:complete len:491 (-) Transcript_107211:52-1524(-)
MKSWQSPIEQQRSFFQIQQLLRGLKIWKDLDANVQQKLPNIVYKVSEKRGAVVFNQGDVPGHCYIVMSGDVAIWIKDEDDKKPPEDDKKQPAANTEASSPSNSSKSSDSEEEKEETPIVNRGRRGSVPAVLPTAVGRRGSVPSLAGGPVPTFARPNFGRRHSAPLIEFKAPPAMGYGKQVATLGKGAIFGELALLNGQPRSATVTCVTDCEFLIIERAEFDAVLKREMERIREEKVSFLRDHIPGVRETPAQRIDKMMYCFVKEAFPKGHVFLRQGEVAQRSVFLVVSGLVELRCKQQSIQGDLETHCVARIIKGGLFGTSPSTWPEPFTAVAAKTACEVYALNERNIKRLPIAVEFGIRRYIAEITLWHLRSCNPVLDPACLKPLRPTTPLGGRPNSATSRPGTPSSRSRTSRPGTPTRNRSKLNPYLQPRTEVTGRSVAEVLINGRFVQSGTIDFAEMNNPRPILHTEKGRRCILRGRSSPALKLRAP